MWYWCKIYSPAFEAVMFLWLETIQHGVVLVQNSQPNFLSDAVVSVPNIQVRSFTAKLVVNFF
jgi:hypothetical protein